jgi:hypothetical protein
MFIGSVNRIKLIVIQSASEEVSNLIFYNETRYNFCLDVNYIYIYLI